MPLFQLLTLCMLASKPIDATIATRAARELFGAGLRTPQAVLKAERATMIDAFGRAHYVRYDESSATRLADIAAAVRDEYGGDLRSSPNPATSCATSHVTSSSSRELATPAPTSSCARSRTSGPGCGRTSTSAPSRQRSELGLPADR